MCHSRSQTKEWAGKRGGLATLSSPHGPKITFSHGILAAAAEPEPNQSRSTLGKVLGEMKISPAKKQVLQSIAGAFPCNAVLRKCPSLPLSLPSLGLTHVWWLGGGLLDLDYSSLPPLLPPPGLAHGWRMGGGLLDLDHSSLPLSPLSSGLARG